MNFLFGFILLSLSLPAYAAFLEDVTASPKQITSCISDSGINPIANQVEFKKIDITGPLPFIRSYSTTLHLTSNDYNQAYYSPMDNEIREMGIGWTHNYAYKLEEGVAADFNEVKMALRLYLPEIGKFITFVRGNGKYLRSSGAPYWGVVKDVETTLIQTSQSVFVANHKGIEIFFEYKSNNQSFIATKVTYPGGKVIHFDYAYSSPDQRWLLKKVSDNLNNALVMNHYENNWDLRGAISSVQTLNNHNQQQTANYSYEVRQITWPSAFFILPPKKPDNVYNFQKLPNLVGVNSTLNPREDYIYSDYSRKATLRSNVRFPVMTEYKENNLTKRIWSYSNTSISSFVPGFANEVRIEKPNNDTLSIYRQLSHTLNKTDTYTNKLNLRNSDVGYVPETVYGNDERFSRFQANGDASCLTYNDIPINNFIVANGLRQMVSIADKYNNRTDFRYDSNGRLLETIEAKGTPLERKAILEYNTKFWIPSLIRWGSLTKTNTINDLGQITQSVQSSTQVVSSNKTTQYTYYPNGLLKSIDGPRKGPIDQVTYTYDNYGNKESESQIVKGVERRTSYLNYNSLGQPERILYPNGLVDQFFYNIDGTVQQKRHGSGGATGNVTGQTWLYNYDDLKRLVNETNPDGEVTSYAYDALNRLIQTNYPDGSIRTKNYFANGVVQAEELWNGNKSNLVKAHYQNLDSYGRVVHTQSGVNGGWFWINKIYDLNGNLVQANTPEGLVERWEYDALNRRVAHVDKAGNYNRTSYDVHDNVISVTDAVGSGSFPLNYRNGNALINERNKDFGFTGYYLNDADLINRITRGDDEARRCDMPDAEIDALERVGHKICSPSEGPAPFNAMYDYLYSYDQSRFGRLDQVTTNADMGVNTSYNYDLYDRPISKTQLNKWGATTVKPLTVSYSYSIGGKLNSITLPSGRKINYKYDIGRTGHLVSVDVANTTLINNINFNPAGEMTGWSWGNGGRYYWANDPALNDLVIFVVNRDRNNNSTFDLLYGYDRDGRIRKKTTDFSKVDDFDYDPAGYLNSETRSVNGSQIYNVTYSYDNNGNRKTLRATGTHQQAASTVDYGYNGNRLSSLIKNGVNEPLRYYNPAGNIGELIGRYSSAQSYDGAGRLAWERGNNGKEWDMRYNHKNERTLLGDNTGSNGGPWLVSTVRQFVYDEESHLIGEYDSNGTALVEYIWLGDQPIAVIMGSGALAKLYYIVNDAQNTPRRLIDPSNDSVVWAWDSTAFGVAPPNIELVKFNLRFPGQYYDSHSGLFYNHNRYYNPELGRYMQPDPIGLEGGTNPYSYAYQNPLTYVDSTGAIATPVITGLIGGVVGGGASLGVQIMKNKGFENIKWKEVGVAASVGAVAGAISPWTAQTAIGAVVTGSGSNVASYWLTQTVNNEPTTTTGFVASAGLGAIGGKLSGPVSRPLQGSSIRAGESQFISRAEANRVNWNINMNSMIRDIDRNLTIGGVGGAIVAGDPFGMGGYNFYSNQATLPYRLPTIRCQAGKGCQ